MREAEESLGTKPVHRPEKEAKLQKLRLEYGLAWAAKTGYYLEETDSTNEDARRYADAGAAHGTVVAAGMQRAGRGRRGRTWISPAWENLYFTLLLRPDFLPEKASMLTLVTALAAAEAIAHKTGLEIGIKWPNDLVCGGKKLCGILTEMRLDSRGEKPAIRDVIVGVGVNVNQTVFAPELRERAVSLRLLSGRSWETDILLIEILKQFEEGYAAFCRQGDLSGLKAAYEARLVNRDRQVRVEDGKAPFTGVARGISETGELLVQCPDGTLEKVYAGEVSVRGIYGYV